MKESNMRKLNIGLDIDQTMYNLDVIEKTSELLGLNYKSTDVKHWVYDKHRVNGFPKYFTDIVYAHFDDPNYMGNLKLFDGVYDKLKQWKYDGHKLYVISARRPSVYIATVKMLKRDFNYPKNPMTCKSQWELERICNDMFESIHFVEHKTDAKLNLFKELELDVWCDDNEKDIENACYMGIKTYAINNKYTQYNIDKVTECAIKYKECIPVPSIGDIEL